MSSNEVRMNSRDVVYIPEYRIHFFEGVVASFASR